MEPNASPSQPTPPPQRTYYDFSKESEIFPKFLLYDNFLKQRETETLFEILDESKDLWETSKVFQVQDKHNVIDPNIRKSMKVKLKTQSQSSSQPDIWSTLNNLFVSKLNKHNPNLRFHLVKDEVEMIKYEKGDFFKAHQDFVHFNSNQIKTYALIYCLNEPNQDSNCEGGETQLYLSDLEKVKCEQTKTPNGLLVMRNELWHEGLEVLSGTKIILKLNLRASLTTDSLIRIVFESEKCLFVQKDQIDKWPNSFFAACLRFKPDQSEIKISNYTFDEFLPISNILFGKQLSQETIYQNSAMLSYFGFEFELQNKFYTYYKDKFDSALIKIDRFLDNSDFQDAFLVAHSSAEYLTFKDYLKLNPDVLTVQWTYTESGERDGSNCIKFICIDSIPVYIKGAKGDLSINNNQDKYDDANHLLFDMIRKLFAVKTLDYHYDMEGFVCKKCAKISGIGTYEELSDKYQYDESDEDEDEDEDEDGGDDESDEDGEDEDKNEDDEDKQDKKEKQEETVKKEIQPKPLKHRSRCLYSRTKNFRKQLCAGILNGLILNEIESCKCVMEAMLHYVEYRYESEWMSLDFNTIVSNHQKSTKQQTQPLKSNLLTNFEHVKSVFPKIQDFLLNVVLTQSETRRVMGAYECNSCEYYEESLHLGLGFINMKKY